MRQRSRAGGFFQRTGWMVLLVALAVTGCSGTESKKTSAPAPAPMQQLDPETGQPLQATTVLVKGKVNKPIVRWHENLTLAEAIVAADYRDQFSPRVILLIRRGQVHRIDPQQLLSGRINPLLEPGDAIDLQQR